MRRYYLGGAFLLGVLCTSGLGAESPTADDATAAESYQLGSSTVTPTPEMLFYLQERRRYEDPGMMVRRKAEFRAAQRRQRIAAMKWFGLSNQRPQVNTTPWYGTYSPVWTGSAWDPYRWIGFGFPTAVFLGGTTSVVNY